MNSESLDQYKDRSCHTLVRKAVTAHQKSTSKENPTISSPSVVEAITPAFWYSPTRFSKKLVFPWREISSIQSKGLLAPNIFGCPRAESSLSATNSMYLVIPM